MSKNLKVLADKIVQIFLQDAILINCHSLWEVLITFILESLNHFGFCIYCYSFIKESKGNQLFAEVPQMTSKLLQSSVGNCGVCSLVLLEVLQQKQVI